MMTEHESGRQPYLYQCTHPEHNDKETCEHRAVSCNYQCQCCAPHFPFVLEKIYPYDLDDNNFKDLLEDYSAIALMLSGPIPDPPFIKGKKYRITIEEVP